MEAPEGQCKCTDNCPMGYIEMAGDIAGKGIPHESEWKLKYIEQCGKECDENAQCNSFLFGKWGLRLFNLFKSNQCKLMKDVLPTDPQYGQTIFCAKCSVYEQNFHLKY